MFHRTRPQAIVRLIAATALVTVFLAIAVTPADAGKRRGFRTRKGKLIVNIEAPDGATMSSNVKLQDVARDRKTKDFVLPADVELQAPRKYELAFSIGGQRIYGRLETHTCTDFTDVSKVRVVITQENVDEVLSGNAQILSMNDPQETGEWDETVTILTLTLGDRPLQR